MKLNRSLLWFGIVGIVGLAVDVTLLTVLRDLLGVYGARVASFLAAATTTWILNRHFSFAGRSANMGIWREYVQYLGLMLGGGLINLATYSVLAWKLAQTPFWLGIYACAGSVLGMAVNFLGASKWLYRH
ncbi:MAG: GtrA family protein [Acidovorax sp.]|uniref:GtrA family protein n=1 Tax=Acidovorax sp. TaxID=1872122 RepID=UPI003918CF2C